MGQVIAESGKRLHRLIENFLIYAQIEILQGDTQKMASLRTGRTPNPEQLIKTHACQQAEMCGRLADLTLVDVSDRPVAMADNYLSKIVDELVQNAFKFSSPGKPVSVSFRPDGRFVILTISDKGRGFEGDHVYKIGAYMQFERKFHEQQGLGLGLTISKRLAEVHGGSLLIESRKGEGAVVAISSRWLPAVAEQIDLAGIPFRQAGQYRLYDAQRLRKG